MLLTCPLAWNAKIRFYWFSHTSSLCAYLSVTTHKLYTHPFHIPQLPATSPISFKKKFPNFYRLQIKTSLYFHHLAPPLHSISTPHSLSSLHNFTSHLYLSPWLSLASLISQAPSLLSCLLFVLLCLSTSTLSCRGCKFLFYMWRSV